MGHVNTPSSHSQSQPCISPRHLNNACTHHLAVIRRLCNTNSIQKCMWEKYAISHTLYDLSIIENVIIIMRLCYSYQAADDAMAADANVPAGRRQGDVDAVPRASPRRRPSDFVDDYDDAPHTASRLASGRGLESPTGSGPPPIVALNETGRGPSRIGATLYQAPSPHSGFTATQNVVSSSAARPVDVDQVSAAVRGGGAIRGGVGRH